MDDSTERIVKALQLVCLLLPPANRRRLHLLLRLMNKMSTNDKLVLDETQPSRTLVCYLVLIFSKGTARSSFANLVGSIGRALDC